jgi:hypothetical protein
MANTVQTQSHEINFWYNYPVIVLQEMDGNDYHYHGLMIGPHGMPYNEALQLLDAAFMKVVNANPFHWDYDDVFSEMNDLKFGEIQAAEWWEGYENTVNSQSREIALWYGHPVIVLQEMDGNYNYHYHGMVNGPKGMPFNKALKLLDAAFQMAVNANPFDWNYDDVKMEMKNLGFDEKVKAAEWWEGNAIN